MEDRIKEYLKKLKMNESMLSMVLGMVTIVIVGVLIFNFYRQTREPQITDEAQETMMPTETIGEVPVVEREGEKFPAELAPTYVVQEGDHLWRIAEKNYGSGYNWVDIARENELGDPDGLRVGMELRLPDVPVIVVEGMTTADKGGSMMMEKGMEPIDGDSYTVVEGDNLWDISVRAYSDGYRWSEVAKANGLANPNYIEVGQVLTLPR